MFISNTLVTLILNKYLFDREAGEEMKLLLVLALLSSSAFAESHDTKHDLKIEDHENNKEAVVTEKAEVKKEDHIGKVSANHHAVYKAAKSACLKENKDLKRKELKDCIISKSK